MKSSESRYLPEEETFSEKEKKNIFQKIYQSKTARILAFWGALGGTGNFESNYRSGHDASRSTAVEYEMSDNELVKELHGSIELPSSGDGYILHIAQEHGGNSRAETNEMMKKADENRQNIIHKQQEIEKILLKLSETYGVQDVFVELVEAAKLDLFENMRTGIDMDEFGKKKRPAERWNTLAHFYNVALQNEGGALQEIDQAHILYFVSQALRNEEEKLRQVLDDAKKHPESVTSEYKEMVDNWKEKNFTSAEATLARLQKLVTEIEQHPLIHGEAVYEWGAAMKLYLEGKITVHPAESIEANQEAFAKYPRGEQFFTHEQLKNPEEVKRLETLIRERQEKWDQGNTLREDAAIQLVTQSPSSKQKIIPLVYGSGHDLLDNVQKINEQGHGYGLMRIE